MADIAHIPEVLRLDLLKDLRDALDQHETVTRELGYLENLLDDLISNYGRAFDDAGEPIEEVSA